MDRRLRRRVLSCARPRFGHASAGSTRIRAMLDRGIVEAVAGPEDPRHDEAASIGASIALLSSSRPPWRCGQTVTWFIDCSAKAGPRRRGLDALWAEVDAAAREFLAAYGVRASDERGPSRPDPIRWTAPTFTA
jgi:hypothetical protein